MGQLQLNNLQTSVYEIPLHTFALYADCVLKCSNNFHRFAVVLYFSQSYTDFIDEHIFKSTGCSSEAIYLIYNFTILQNQKRMNLITMRCIGKRDRFYYHLL